MSSNCLGNCIDKPGRGRKSATRGQGSNQQSGAVRAESVNTICCESSHLNTEWTHDGMGRKLWPLLAEGDVRCETNTELLSGDSNRQILSEQHKEPSIQRDLDMFPLQIISIWENHSMSHWGDRERNSSFASLIADHCRWVMFHDKHFEGNICGRQ